MPPACLPLPVASAVEIEREPVVLRVIAVNPSSEKTQTVPVRIDLPQEVSPKDILDRGDLGLEYDEERALYYVFKEEIELAPKETRVFEVVVRDLWFVPQEKLDHLKNYTGIVLSRLQKTEYLDSAKQLADSIGTRLDEIGAMQMDEGLSRKARIGNYRRNLQALDQIKEDLARMEKLLSFTGGPPVPEMLEESPLKSDAPSTTTTWLVIFMIMIFLGFLGGQFFFTWHRRIKASQDVAQMREAAFSLLQRPEGKGSSTPAISPVDHRSPPRQETPTGTDGQARLPGMGPQGGPASPPP
jgi:hypothetical protein